jgi:hypothetical protein
MKITELIQEAPYLSKYPEPREPYVKDGKTIGKIIDGKPIPLSKSDAIGPDGKIYYFMDPRSRGEEEQPYKFRNPSNKPSNTPTGSGKQYPDPLEPVFKDGKPVGVVMPNGRTRPWSKSDALGPDGKVYNWMDPRGRKPKSESSELDEYVGFDERRVLAKQVQRAIATGDLSQWDEFSSEEKFYALQELGMVSDTASSWEWKDAIKLDRVLQTAIRTNQDERYQTELGPEKRAELKTKVDELAEMQRQQLRQERIEDQKIAYDRYKDEAERKDAMAKIDKEYKNNLEVINTEHRNNMEAIRTGNKHEIEKINLDHEEAARERKHELDRDKRNDDSRPSDREQDFPEPEEDNEDDDEKGEPFRPQAPAGPALSAPKPDKKPSKYDNSDAIDADFKEVPDDKDEPRKPPQLPRPSAKESLEIARIRQLAGLKENIFTTDYHKVMDAVAKLYGDHYDINIWENGDAHDEAAKVLMKEHPTDDELDYIVNTGDLPERFMELDFPLNDDIMYGAGVSSFTNADVVEGVVDEEPASRALCQSGKPDSALGASQLSSCKSQGYRSRDGGKSHKVGSERVKVRGKKIKGKKYGGPLPDWS